MPFAASAAHSDAANPVPAQGEDTPLQFTTSGGKLLGFGSSSIILASQDLMLRVELPGANLVAPVCQGTATEASGSPGAARPFTRVTYPNVWDNVTVVYEPRDGAVFKSTYNIAPSHRNAVCRIRLRYNPPVSLDAQGNLVIAYANGTMTDSTPVSWQDICGQRKFAQVSYVLLGTNEVGFAVGDYNHSRRLVIDPTLTWNSFFGGSGNDYAQAVAVDGSGNVYVAGYSSTTWASPVRAFGTGTDGFAAQLSSGGSLTWSTFLGGSGTDRGNAIAANSSGSVYVAGHSSATWGSPVRSYTGSNDAFVVKFAVAVAAAADVKVTKTGPSSVFATSNLVVSDVLPTNSIFVSASSGGTNVRGVVNRTIASFVKTATTSLTVTVTAPAASGTLSNVVSSTASTTDPTPSNNNGSATNAQVVTTVTPCADIATTKTAATNAVASSNLTYKIMVTKQP